jgi:hypothetical protein
MIIIQGAYETAIRHFGFGKQFLPIGKTVLLGYTQAVRQGIQAVFSGLRNGYHLQLFGMLLGKTAVGSAPAAGTEDNGRDGFHNNASLLSLFFIVLIFQNSVKAFSNHCVP